MKKQYEIILGTPGIIRRKQIDAENRKEAMDIAIAAFIKEHPVEIYSARAIK